MRDTLPARPDVVGDLVEGAADIADIRIEEMRRCRRTIVQHLTRLNSLFETLQIEADGEDLDPFLLHARAQPQHSVVEEILIVAMVDTVILADETQAGIVTVARRGIDRKELVDAVGHEDDDLLDILGIVVPRRRCIAHIPAQRGDRVRQPQAIPASPMVPLRPQGLRALILSFN